MKNLSNISVNSNEIMQSNERLTNCLTEQIAAAMLLLASVENELGRLNEIEDEALDKRDDKLQDLYDAESEKFNITIAFKQHTVKIDLQCMDTYDSFIGFLYDCMKNADLYR